jgi:hypothetical protein
MPAARSAKRRCSTALLLTALVAVTACGRTKATERLAPGGDAGAPAADTCVPSASINEAPSAPLAVLPTTLEGTLCGDEDRLRIAFDGKADDPQRPGIRARLVDGSALSPYTLTLFGVDQGELQPLPGEPSPRVFTLSPDAPEVEFGVAPNSFSESTVVLELEGPAGPVALELERPELSLRAPCDGEYEGLPAQTPTRVLPTLIETELCNARDSRVWAIEGVAGRAVSITLENPLTVDSFELHAHHSGADPYEDLQISAGKTRTRLGLLAERSFSFTPAASGIIGLYAALGISRAEPIRLRVEQQGE